MDYTIAPTTEIVTGWQLTKLLLPSENLTGYEHSSSEAKPPPDHTGDHHWVDPSMLRFGIYLCLCQPEGCAYSNRTHTHAIFNLAAQTD